MIYDLSPRGVVGRGRRWTASTYSFWQRAFATDGWCEIDGSEARCVNVINGSMRGPTVFRGKFDKFRGILVNSAAHRGKADEIPRFTADTQLNYRGLIKSW